MGENHTAGIRAPGTALSARSLAYLFVIYIGAMWGMLLGLLLLVRFFPAVREWDWLPAAPSVLVLVFFLAHFLGCWYTVILEPDGVTLKWFGIPFRRIPVSRFKIFCAVGNGREDDLCLCCHSVSEMARMQEARLLRSFLDKHDVPLRKRRPDWQESFAREYLNRLRKDPFSVFTERDVVMFEMHPALQRSVRKMYPQLPYRNYTGVTSRYASRFSDAPEDQAVCFSPQYYTYQLRMEPEGIHISTPKEEIAFLPEEKLRTAVRVDIFKGYDKFYPHHMPLLYLSGMTEEELAGHPYGRGYGGIKLDESADRAAMTVMAASCLALRWNRHCSDSCVVHYTEKNLDRLRRLYPHIQLQEAAACWLEEDIPYANAEIWG